MQRNLRRKIGGESYLNEEIDSEKQVKEQEELAGLEIISEDKDNFQTPKKLNKNLPNQETPKQRNKILNIFGIGTPSPFLKFSKSTEEDLKRLSVAVHLWAHKQCGSMNMLQEERLKDKHFHQILSFTGPSSKWHILKDRPASQYKKMWRNAMKGIHYYRGHPETGYETQSKLHSPEAPFCLFQHCKPGLMTHFDLDLTVLTPLQERVEPINKIVSHTNRRLFTPQKNKQKRV